VLAIFVRAGITVFKITICVMVMHVTVMVAAMFFMIIAQTIILLKCMVSMMMAKDILMITVLVIMRRASKGFLFPRWNCRSGNLGFSPPVDGDGDADSKIGNNHYTRVEEDKGLRCNLT